MDNKEDSIFNFGEKPADKSPPFSVSAEAERLQSLDAEVSAESKLNNSEPGKVAPTADRLKALMGNKFALAGGGFLVLVLSGFIYVNFIYSPPNYGQVAQQVNPEPQPTYTPEPPPTMGQYGSPMEEPQGFSLDGETMVTPGTQIVESSEEQWTPPGTMATETVASDQPQPMNQPSQDNPITKPEVGVNQTDQGSSASGPTGQLGVADSKPSGQSSPMADESEIEALKKQIAEKDKKIASLSSQLNQSQRKYQVLSSKSRQLLAKEKEMMDFYSQKESKASNGKELARPTSASGYRIRAITEGLAWVDSGNGQTYTVRIGDSLPDIGNIIFIDADKMSIKGSRGEIK